MPVAGGALAELRVVEMDAIGPVPLLGTLLADFGADVVRIARPGGAWTEADLGAAILHRSRRSLSLDLKAEPDRARALDLIGRADAVIEGFRPGVMERLGLGPDACLARNPVLVFGRMTGWGQTGPRAPRAGHDINYLAISGALGMIGPRERPLPPLNLVADYGGGAMVLAFGLLAAILNARATGRGQVVDAAMTDGVAFLMSLFHFYGQSGQWAGGREGNLLDGGAPFYACYPCADGGFVAVGALEPAFFRLFMTGIGLDPAAFPQDDRAGWPAMRQAIAARLAGRPRDHWAAVFAESDACVTPVLSAEEARADPHNRARQVHAEQEGFWQAAAAPRLSRTPARMGPRGTVDYAALAAEWSAR